MKDLSFIEMDFELEFHSSNDWDKVVNSLFDRFLIETNASLRSENMARSALSKILSNLYRIYAYSNQEESFCISYSRCKDCYKGMFPGYNLTIKIIDWMRDAGLCDGLLGYNDRASGISRLSRLRYTKELANKFYRLKDVQPPRKVTQDLIRIKNYKKIHIPDYNKFLEVVFESRLEGKASCMEKARLINDVRSRHRLSHLNKTVPVNDIYRIYNNSNLGEGGRFYGCYAQQQPSAVRSELKIDGKDAVELDYSAFHARLLYDIKGISIKDDPYVVEGFDRKLVKQTFLRMLNNSEKTTLKSVTKMLREKWPHKIIDAENLITRIRSVHSQINISGSECCVGLKLQRIDSDIAMEVMFHFAQRDILCLCVHDSFIVAEEFKEELRQVMIDKYNEIVRLEFAKNYQMKNDRVCLEEVWSKMNFIPAIK